MADDDTSGSSRGWFERLMSAFSGDPQNLEQLIELLRNFHQHHLLGADELFMIEGVLQVSDMQVRDIMIPRGRMTVLEHSSKLRTSSRRSPNPATRASRLSMKTRTTSSASCWPRICSRPR